MREVPRGVAVPGEDRGAVAELVLVDEPERLLVVLRPHHAQDRPEDLFLVDTHVRGHAVEDAAADEEAVLVAFDGGAAAVHDQARPFLDADVDVAPDLVAVLAGDQRPHLDAAGVEGADLQRLDPRLQPLDQIIGGLVTDRDRHRHRHAALAGRAIGRADEGVGHLVHVRVGHDHQMVLRPAERLHPLARGGPGAVDVLRDRGRADEAHRRHVLVGEQRIHRFLVAVDDVQHAGRRPGLDRQLGEPQAAGRILLRGFQHEGVAAGQGHRIHPHRDHGRKVEGRDAGAYAQRLADAEAVHAAGDVLVHLALEELGDPAGELDDLDAAGDRSAGVVEGLAVLGGADAGQLLAMRFEDIAVAEQDARALRGRGRRPRGERRLRRPDRLADLARGGERHPRLDPAARRVVDVAEAVALAGDALTVDEVPEGGGVRIVAGHGSSPEDALGNTLPVCFRRRRGYHRIGGRLSDTVGARIPDSGPLRRPIPAWFGYHAPRRNAGMVHSSPASRRSCATARANPA